MVVCVDNFVDLIVVVDFIVGLIVVVDNVLVVFAVVKNIGLFVVGLVVFADIVVDFLDEVELEVNLVALIVIGFGDVPPIVGFVDIFFTVGVEDKVALKAFFEVFSGEFDFTGVVFSVVSEFYQKERH